MENMTYLEFPERKVNCAGANFIDADLSNRIMAQLPPVVYIHRDGQPLHLYLVIPERHEDFVPVREPDGTVNDILYPTNRDGRHFMKYPLIVYIQGSGWLKQNIGFRMPMLSRIVKKGYAMAFVEYRSSDDSCFPAQIQDVKTAIRFLKANADKYSLDPERIVIWGDSSGGHTALMVGLTENMKEFDTEPYSDWNCKIKGVIDFYGPADLRAFKGPEIEKLMGGTQNTTEEKLWLASPVCYAERCTQHSPFVIFQGTKDRVVPAEQSITLYEALKKNGADAEIYIIKGGDHGRAEFWCDEVFETVEYYLEKWMK